MTFKVLFSKGGATYFFFVSKVVVVGLTFHIDGTYSSIICNVECFWFRLCDIHYLLKKIKKIKGIYGRSLVIFQDKLYLFNIKQY